VRCKSLTQKIEPSSIKKSKLGSKRDLFSRIEEFFNKHQVAELTLEELFLEADRIGNKYLTTQEISEFNQKFAIEVNEIAEKIDQQFPDTEVEFIDFSTSSNKRYRHKKYIKI
jgi:hypothetical protein